MLNRLTIRFEDRVPLVQTEPHLHGMLHTFIYA